MLMTAGARHIIAVDENGILVPGRPQGLPGHKAHLAEITNPERMSGTLADAIRGADVFIGTSVGGALTPEMAATMGQGCHRLCHGKPHPRDHARPGQGRRRAGGGHRPQRFPQSGEQRAGLPRHFPGCFVGARPGHQPRHEDGRRQGHRRADPRRGAERGRNILPKAFDPRIAGAVADAVAKAARESGVARV